MDRGTKWSSKLNVGGKRWSPPHPLGLFEMLPSLMCVSMCKTCDLFANNTSGCLFIQSMLTVSKTADKKILKIWFSQGSQRASQIPVFISPPFQQNYTDCERVCVYIKSFGSIHVTELSVSVHMCICAFKRISQKAQVFPEHSVGSINLRFQESNPLTWFIRFNLTLIKYFTYQRTARCHQASVKPVC